MKNSTHNSGGTSNQVCVCAHVGKDPHRCRTAISKKLIAIKNLKIKNIHKNMGQQKAT